MGMFRYKWTKRFREKKRVLKNGRSSSGKQDWSKVTSGKNKEERKQLTNLAPLKVFFGS